jgi:hypothetical protein
VTEAGAVALPVIGCQSGFEVLQRYEVHIEAASLHTTATARRKLKKINLSDGEGSAALDVASS